MKTFFLLGLIFLCTSFFNPTNAQMCDTINNTTITQTINATAYYNAPWQVCTKANNTNPNDTIVWVQTVLPFSAPGCFPVARVNVTATHGPIQFKGLGLPDLVTYDSIFLRKSFYFFSGVTSDTIRVAFHRDSVYRDTPGDGMWLLNPSVKLVLGSYPPNNNNAQNAPGCPEAHINGTFFLNWNNIPTPFPVIEKEAQKFTIGPNPLPQGQPLFWSNQYNLVHIFNALGQSMHTKIPQNLDPGVYFLQFQNKQTEKINTTKLIIKQ